MTAMTLAHMLHVLTGQWHHYTLPRHHFPVRWPLARIYLHRINGAPWSYNRVFLHWLEQCRISPRGWVNANQS